MALPLLDGNEPSVDVTQPAAPRSGRDDSTAVVIGRPVLRRLYLSHLLSTLNSRVFEFGAVLFLAAAYPGSLAPLSIYALARNVAAVVLSRAVGWWIDVGDRLAVVRASIIAGRAAVVASCGALLALMLLLEGDDGKSGGGRDSAVWGPDLLFAGLAVLACVEKLASIMNLLAVERDWVVVMTEDDDALRRSECCVSSSTGPLDRAADGR